MGVMALNHADPRDVMYANNLVREVVAELESLRIPKSAVGRIATLEPEKHSKDPGDYVRGILHSRGDKTLETVVRLMVASHLASGNRMRLPWPKFAMPDGSMMKADYVTVDAVGKDVAVLAASCDQVTRLNCDAVQEMIHNMLQDETVASLRARINCSAQAARVILGRPSPSETPRRLTPTFTVIRTVARAYGATFTV